MAGQQAQKVRIIGGRWRRWQVPVADHPGLRPTPDRVRETLFNWLAEQLDGARCLDLFAGTGVLGLEALSRGAQALYAVEQDRRLAEGLRNQLQRLDCTAGTVACADALHWLQQPPPLCFDVVFVDPPYRSGLLAPVLAALARPGWLAGPAWVYLEFAADEAGPALPAGWQQHRQARAGQVCAWLCRAGVDSPG